MKNLLPPFSILVLTIQKQVNSPIKQARKVAAKTHLGSMVHMTQSFRFVIERAFLPKEEL